MLPETIDLMAGTPLILNNVLVSAICGALVWLTIWRHHISPSRAAWIVFGACLIATAASHAMKVVGDLYAIGGTEAVLLYEAIASAALGALLAAGFAVVVRR